MFVSLVNNRSGLFERHLILIDQLDDIDTRLCPSETIRYQGMEHVG